MEELTEVITAAEFHPNQCNTFVYSSSKGTIRLCDMRASALCDNHAKSEPTFTAFSFFGVSLNFHLFIRFCYCDKLNSVPRPKETIFNIRARKIWKL